MDTRLPLFGLIALACAGCAGETTRIYTVASPYGEEGLHVSGTAVVRTPPDYAVVTIGTETSASGARNASETNKAVMSKVLAAIRAQGIDAKDIHTVHYSLDSTYDRPTPRTRVLLWRVNNDVEVRVRAVDKVADVVDAATDAGANHIGGVRYAVEDLHAARAKARERAGQVARDKAEQLAKVLGGRLGRLVAVRDGGMRGYWNLNGLQAQANVNNDMGRAESAPIPAGAAESEISTGQIAIEATEDVTYELK